MVKKIFARARLIKGKRWHIEYYEVDVQTGEEKRHRQDFDLNDEPDLVIREAVARRLVTNLEKFVKACLIREEAKANNAPGVLAAMNMAYAEKQKLPRKNSAGTYRIIINALRPWLKAEKLEKKSMSEFTRKEARDFWEHLNARRPLRIRTQHNYLMALQALWSEFWGLWGDQISDEEETKLQKPNPWIRVREKSFKLRHVAKETKQRRPFTAEERAVVAGYAEKNDYWMFRGILLQYYCYIRPVEICRLQFGDFNFRAGTITVRWTEAKNWKERTVTIPKSVLHYFIDGKFDRYPANFFLYGMPDERGRGGGLCPDKKPADPLRMGKRHAQLLVRLQKRGELQEIKGLSWYSWKDSGISAHTSNTSQISTKDQAGHSDFKITDIYYHAEKVNEEYRKLPHDLYGLDPLPGESLQQPGEAGNAAQ